MKNSVAIYLAGSIQKAHEIDRGSYWTEEDMICLKHSLHPYEVFFLNPAFRTDDLSDQRSVFGRDMFQVFSSDVVFVDARDRRGLGVGAEMMWARANKIPVVIWSPKDTHYHKTSTTVLDARIDNWIHPFVDSLGDAIVENLVEGAHWIRKFIEDPLMEIRGLDSVESAMLYYKESQFSKDEPMKKLFESSSELSQKLCLLGSSPL